MLFGGDSAEEPPVPIPNTVVKLRSADGTAGLPLWESRTPPDHQGLPSHLRGWGVFFLAHRGRELSLRKRRRSPDRAAAILGDEDPHPPPPRRVPWRMEQPC